MVSKKTGRGQALKGADLKKFRSDVAKLKSKGLVSGKIDARSQKPTRYMREKVASYSGVLSGSEKVVHARSSKQARGLAELFGTRSSGKAVPVPTGKNGRARVIKGKKGADDTVRVYSTENGKRTVSDFVSGVKDNIRGLPTGSNIRYRVTFAHGQYIQFDTLRALEEFMSPYELDSKRPWTNWRRYIQIVRVQKGSGDFDGDLE